MMIFPRLPRQSGPANQSLSQGQPNYTDATIKTGRRRSTSQGIQPVISGIQPGIPQIIAADSRRRLNSCANVEKFLAHHLSGEVSKDPEPQLSTSSYIALLAFSPHIYHSVAQTVLLSSPPPIHLISYIMAFAGKDTPLAFLTQNSVAAALADSYISFQERREALGLSNPGNIDGIAREVQRDVFLTGQMFTGLRADLTKAFSMNPLFQVSHAFSMGSQMPPYAFAALFGNDKVRMSHLGIKTISLRMGLMS
jgi:hypothetical protein